MIYTLVTRTGREYTFYTLSLAEIYRNAYGGEILVLDSVDQLAA
jgi:hypothetical protein